MNKKLTTALIAIVASLTLAVPTASSAEQLTQTPTLAILDTALDTSLPIFQGKIAQEVCILDWKSCPNGTNFQEGVGSSVIPLNIMSSKDFNHGTQMATAALKTNPNMKIVFIRIIGNTPAGARQTSGVQTVINALDWVIKNKDKYNIQAVSMSQGHHNLLPGLNYCPNNNKLPAYVSSLKLTGVPFFTAAGNGRDYKRIDWPSCIQDTISVGATDQIGEIASYSNNDDILLDFFANGSMPVYIPGGKEINAAGTSVSAQVAAAQWVSAKQKNSSYTFDSLIKMFNDTALVTKGRQGTFKKLINWTNN
jgi:hypothetical protein